jgi:type I restriction enzyme, S subunit
MEVKPGYTPSALGEIPADWNEAQLGALGTFIKGKGVARSQADSGGIPCVRYGEIYTKHSEYVRQYFTHISAEVASQSTRLQRGDVLFAGSGETKAEIGKSVAIIDDTEAYAGGDIVILRNTALHPHFAGYLLNMPYVTAQKAARGQGDAVVHISASALADVRVALPPLHEQRAIATALSDVDDLLTSLDRLIAKKRAIKQGVMHDLLTGRKRLPGFGGKWREVSIGELANVDPEVLPQATDPNYEFNYIALEDVTRGTLRSFQRLRFATAPSRARRILRYHDILIGTVRPNLQSHLLHVRRESSWICSTGFSVVRCDPSHAWPDFVFHSFFGMNLNNQIATLIAGSNYPAISRRDVAALTIPTPPLHEQRAIGTVLTDLDDEIDALQSRRDKTHAIKQAMMHELLTGRTRLV